MRNQLINYVSFGLPFDLDTFELLEKTTEEFIKRNEDIEEYNECVLINYIIYLKLFGFKNLYLKFNRDRFNFLKNEFSEI